MVYYNSLFASKESDVFGVPNSYSYFMITNGWCWSSCRFQCSIINLIFIMTFKMRTRFLSRKRPFLMNSQVKNFSFYVQVPVLGVPNVRLIDFRLREVFPKISFSGTSRPILGRQVSLSPICLIELLRIFSFRNKTWFLMLNKIFIKRF